MQSYANYITFFKSSCPYHKYVCCLYSRNKNLKDLLKKSIHSALRFFPHINPIAQISKLFLQLITMSFNVKSQVVIMTLIETLFPEL